MKRFAVVLVLAVLLCGGPRLFACADCQDLNGKASCAWGHTSGMGSCWVKTDYSDCRGTFGCDDGTGAAGSGGSVRDFGLYDECGNPLTCPPGGIYKY
jgi:hypothetical protein